MYKVLFFDLDDTLWDTRSNGRESMEEVFYEYKFDRFFPSFNAFYDIYFPHNCMLWQQYREGKITKDELIIQRLYYPLRDHIEYDREFLLTLNEVFLDRTTTKKKLLPDAMEILEYLSPMYEMYIISNGFEEVQSRKMDHSGLTPFFRDMILSDHIGENKPHPAIFEYALKKADYASDDVLMIGDSWDADMIGARNAGIDQCWYDLGIEKSAGFQPTFRITSLNELRKIL